MLGKRRRRWTDIKPTVCQRLVFPGISWEQINNETRTTVLKSSYVVQMLFQ